MIENNSARCMPGWLSVTPGTPVLDASKEATLGSAQKPAPPFDLGTACANAGHLGNREQPATVRNKDQPAFRLHLAGFVDGAWNFFEKIIKTCFETVQEAPCGAGLIFLPPRNLMERRVELPL
jgi:hypothetical protein